MNSRTSEGPGQGIKTLTCWLNVIAESWRFWRDLTLFTSLISENASVGPSEGTSPKVSKTVSAGYLLLLLSLKGLAGISSLDSPELRLYIATLLVRIFYIVLLSGICEAFSTI